MSKKAKGWVIVTARNDQRSLVYWFRRWPLWEARVHPLQRLARGFQTASVPSCVVRSLSLKRATKRVKEINERPR